MRTEKNKKAALAGIYKAAVHAASPYNAVRDSLRLVPSGGRLILRARDTGIDLDRVGRIFVAGAGKAVCQMARAVEEVLGDRIRGGLVVTKYGQSVPLKTIETVEAGHPIPDRNGAGAARRVMRIADEAREGDLLIVLLTGGASALLPAPSEGIGLKDKQRLSKLLINSGASIDEINAVRKHLSRIKGGRLVARAWPARVLTLIVSDVVGSDLSSIGSGPTAPDPTTFEDCLGVLKRYGLLTAAPRNALGLLRGGARGRAEETPKPVHKAFANCDNLILADNLSSLAAAKGKAASLGFRTLILSSTVAGPTREAARLFSSILKEVRRSGNPVRPPACVLMGGETTLKVTGKGKGGRNQEFALAAAMELKGEKGVFLLSAGTDGSDGPTDAAGAFALPETLETAKRLKLDPLKYLSANDSYGFFRRTGGLFITGPTGTNVMDVVIGLVE